MVSAIELEKRIKANTEAINYLVMALNSNDIKLRQDVPYVDDGSTPPTEEEEAEELDVPTEEELK